MKTSKAIKMISDYIRENPDCIIEYCDSKNFIMYSKNKKKHIERDGFGWDWDINDDGEDYIPNIALIFHECAKKGIDISKVKIISC